MLRHVIRWALVIGATALLVVVTTGLLVRWTIKDKSLRASILAGAEHASGLRITATGPMTIRMLPHPTVELREVSVRGAAGAVRLDADMMRGRLDLGALVGGDLRIVSAGFDSPTAVLDVDRLQPVIAGMFARRASAGATGPLHTGGITFHAGVVRLLSADPRRDATVTDIAATFEWPDDDAEASLTGSATWRGITGALSVDIDKPGRWLRGGQALASVRLKSDIVDLDAEGTLAGGDTPASGKLSASTPDLQGFLRAIGMPAPQLAGLHQARLSGTASIANETLALDGTDLSLDDMLFEGALAIRQRDGRTSLAGTLATDRIDLGPFMRAFPRILTESGDWNGAPLGTAAVANDDIDLRISVSAARLGTFLMEDGSLSLQSGDGRMELTLGEARAYDGLLKGRILATVDGEATDVRAEAELSRLDVKSLLKDLPGDYRASGTVTSHFAVEGRGSSPAALTRTLTGEGQLTVRNGEIGGRLLATVLNAAPSAGTLALPLAADGRAPFDTASFTVTLDRGALAVTDSWIAWPALRAAIEGHGSVPQQRLDLTARVGSSDGTDGPLGPDEVFDIAGPWRHLRLMPAAPTAR